MLQNGLAWQATAAANLLEARKKHGRLGSKKSRRGCLTCKARHVKCDESWPQCNRCRSTGRNCEGYIHPTTSSKTQNSLVRRQLSNPLGLCEDDRRQLDFFLSEGAPGLAGSLDRDFWCGAILQIAQSEPIVLSGLLAISTLYEHPPYLTSFRKTSDVTPSAYAYVRTNESVGVGAKYYNHDPPRSAHHVKAIKLYNKAIQGFQQRMNDGTASVMLALVTCIVFIAIETIQDHVFAALPLFEKGANMLNQNSTSVTGLSEQDILAHVRQMFTRFGVLATAFGHATPPLEPQRPESYLSGQVFQNMAEARRELFSLLEQSNGFCLATDRWRELLFQAMERQHESERDHDGIRSTDTNAKTAFDELNEALPVRVNSRGLALLSETSEADLRGDFGDVLADILDDSKSARYNFECGFSDLKELQEEQHIHLQKLEKWRKAFEALCNDKKAVDTDTSSYLYMMYYTFFILLSTRDSTRKTAFDDYAAEFDEVVRHAESHLELKAGERPVFTFDIGAVPSLWHTATECRVPSIRRRALALLKKAPKKESIMGAEGSAEIAACLISFEERDLGLPDPTDFNNLSGDVDIDDTILPAEGQRWHSMEIFKNRLTKAYELRVTTLSEVDGRLVRSFEDVPM